jgi:xanthine/CO dehydrogenase XdhC/CoxF family maturation factor
MIDIVFQALADAARAGEPVTLGVITGVKGSSPQKVGAKALFHGDGRILGTLGGGCLEAEIQHRAVEALRTGEPSTFDLVLDHDFGWDDGLICGGKVFGVILPNAQRYGAGFWSTLAERQASLTWGVRGDLSVAGPGPAGTVASSGNDWLYRETITPPCALWIAGAGHIAQAVAPLAWQLDFDVSVFDDRPALANHDYFPATVFPERRPLANPLLAASPRQTQFRTDRHPRPSPRRARAQGLDPQTVLVSRNDRQLTQGANHPRPFPGGKNRHGRRIGTRCLPGGHPYPLPERAGDRREHPGPIH